VTRTAARIVPGIRALADAHDAFIVDQWGVLHDGTTAYPGAADCLRRLSAAGKRVVILSNSGRRAAHNEARLAELGIARETYAATMSSGEAVWRALGGDGGAAAEVPGRRCLLISRGGDRSMAAGLDLAFVTAPEDADFILLSGSDMPERPPESYRPLLAAAARRRLPLLCANPDTAGVTAAGLIPGPGLLAHRYAELGGPVRWFGKPHPEVHALCRPALGGTADDRTIAIGDSLAHDIAGGQRMGFTTALVAGGIHGGALSVRLDAADDRPRLETLFAEHGVVPDWVVPAFRW